MKKLFVYFALTVMLKVWFNFGNDIDGTLGTHSGIVVGSFGTPETNELDTASYFIIKCNKRIMNIPTDEVTKMQWVNVVAE